MNAQVTPPDAQASPSVPQLFRIATRASRLALWQAGHVAECIRALYPDSQVELVRMTTQGDRILDRPLADIGGKGLFTKELELAMLDGRADLAVHSLKDVPMDLPGSFELAAILKREDPRDAFVSNVHGRFDALPAGAVVGTSSVRRAALLQELRPDLRIEPLRGNLDTRLGRLDEGRYDAIVLATAGLVRLGAGHRIRHHFDTDTVPPAPGQGAIAIETVRAHVDMTAALKRLTHGPAWLAALAERQVSRRLGGSCRTPLAAHARWQGQQGVAAGSTEPGDGASRLELRAYLAVDGGPSLRACRVAEVRSDAQAEALGESVAEDIASARR